MEPQGGEIPVERVPSAFYSDFLTLVVEVEYLKAEIACLKAKDDEPTPPKTRRRKRKKPV
jgi:hypothetical protein